MYVHTHIPTNILMYVCEQISIPVYLYLIYEFASNCLFAVWQLIWVPLIASEMSLLYSLKVRAHRLAAIYLHARTHTCVSVYIRIVYYFYFPFLLPMLFVHAPNLHSSSYTVSICYTNRTHLLSALSISSYTNGCYAFVSFRVL